MEYQNHKRTSALYTKLVQQLIATTYALIAVVFGMKYHIFFSMASSPRVVLNPISFCFEFTIVSK